MIMELGLSSHHLVLLTDNDTHTPSVMEGVVRLAQTHSVRVVMVSRLHADSHYMRSLRGRSIQNAFASDSAYDVLETSDQLKSVTIMLEMCTIASAPSIAIKVPTPHGMKKLAGT
jgi:hypothetical protein